MRQTAVDLHPTRIAVGNAILDVTGTCVQRGALGQVVFIAGSGHEAAEVLVDYAIALVVVGIRRSIQVT